MDDNRDGAGTACHHCGTPCRDRRFSNADQAFCCQGCLTVYELLVENGLGHFYDLGRQAGVRVGEPASGSRFRFLDEPSVRDRMLDFADATISKVTFHIPAIHCIACVWLLENLFQLRPGIGRSTVNFPRRECAITFEHGNVRLSEVAALVASLGYEPSFNLATVEGRREDPIGRRLWLRTGVAGFAFGNTMLVSVASYLGLSAAEHPDLKVMFGYLSLALALPVLLYSASDYWRAAWFAVRRRLLTIDVPIGAGLLALFGQSTLEVVTRRGDGYFDSLTGLIFFLLCGKLFQHKTYDRLTFDRDYRSFFPLSVLRRNADGEESVPLSRVTVGDRLILRHGELVPADARLLTGHGVIDYSFVTGEADPVEKDAGDHLYAGGRQLGGAIEIETVKAVSQSYLTTLWGHAAFGKQRRDTLDTLTNRFSRRFTITVVAAAFAAAVFWAWSGDSARALKAFTSVLIVACPCALALAAPFALGTAQRFLARRNIFVKNQQVLETLARIGTIVFDKTGTLTTPNASEVIFQGPALTQAEVAAVLALVRHSTHPYAVRIAAVLADGSVPPSEGAPATYADADPRPIAVVTGFRETPGAGIAGHVGGHEFLLGSADWLRSRGIPHTLEARPTGPATHLAISDRYRGHFLLDSLVRPEAEAMLHQLSAHHEVVLLSGDSEKERARFRRWFKTDTHLHFNQSPLNKLEFIENLQRSGKPVLMVGDGLNDAGALKQSDVGVAVVEDIGAFSPASDVILDAAQLPALPTVLKFSRATVRVVRVSFLISSLYNVAGITIAAAGLLSPMVCAVLMPLSSFTVVAFACGVTKWMARRGGLAETQPARVVR